MSTPPAATRPEAAARPAPLPQRTDRTRPGPATRQTTLILGPVNTAPRCARATLHEALTRWGLAHLTDPGQLITSELVTNAITASNDKAPPGTEPAPVTLWITAANGELRIRVWDPDPVPPPRHQPVPGDNDERGRGLLIVAALASQWGTHPAPNGGKYTWAALPLNAPAALARPPQRGHE